MTVKTRLDGRSKENYMVSIVHTDTEEVVGEISIPFDTNITLEISTADGFHLRKLNGWTSSKVRTQPLGLGE